ncbi:MAG TPA: insecticidal delta-endotoxin Cry8Ea1 family protein [Pyrinomonadaceae bacterium]|nr:insecticidal delta-endotoxin Cry8Ea1 family protein [Pyrinomonadaceae bacterium]
MFVVTNEYKEEVFYFVADTDDDSYRVAYDGNYGWLKKGEKIRLSLPSGEKKIGFRKGRMPFSDWFAKPEKVKTNRPVTLTSDCKIVQPDHEFPNPDATQSVNFMDEFNTQVNDLSRKAVLAAIGKIPTVGEGIAVAVGLIWPEKKPTVEDLVKASEERMKAWVHGVVDEYDRQLLKSKVGSLRRNLKEYMDADEPSERQTWLDTCLGQFNDAKELFIGRKYTPGSVGLAVDLGTMHLALLRERVVKSKEIFGDKKVSVEKHKQALKDGIAEYQKFVREVAIPGEMKWRESMMDIEEFPQDALGRAATVIHDNVAREVHSFAKGLGARGGGDHTVLVHYYKEQALNSYRAALQSNVADPALLWSMLDPDQQQKLPIPIDRDPVWVGPCTGLVFKGNNEHGGRADRWEDRPGRVSKVHVREWNEVDYLKFYYDGHEGNGVGKADGGAPQDVQVPPGKFITRVETWWDWELSGIKFHFSDGTSTGVLGNRTGMGQHYQSASYPNHRVNAVRIEGTPPYQGRPSTINALWFGFAPLPDYYEPKKLS